MKAGRRTMGICVLLGAGGLLLHAALGLSQPARPGPNPGAGKVLPKLEPYAETRLLMEGLAQANFRGLERILTQQPNEDKAWVFGRGQALLLAETGNLLMLRPPRNDGEPVWFQRASDFRAAAVQLAASMGQRDFQRSRNNLFALANTCNRCHQTFRIPAQIKPFEEQLKVSH